MDYSQAMPDKRHPCNTKDCQRCWRNRLKHGNPETKRWLRKQHIDPASSPAVVGEQRQTAANETRPKPRVLNNTGDTSSRGWVGTEVREVV